MRRGDGHDVAIAGPAAEVLAGRFALIVAIVQPDGTPYATRGWGLTVLSACPARVRLVVPADDLAQLAAGGGRRAVAITAGHPSTLRSVQLKGWAGPPEPASAEDREAVARFREGFFGAVAEADRTDPRLLELLAPSDYVACTVEVEELFDQTPGPGAGAALAAPGP